MEKKEPSEDMDTPVSSQQAVEDPLARQPRPVEKPIARAEDAQVPEDSQKDWDVAQEVLEARLAKARRLAEEMDVLDTPHTRRDESEELLEARLAEARRRVEEMSVVAAPAGSLEAAQRVTARLAQIGRHTDEDGEDIDLESSSQDVLEALKREAREAREAALAQQRQLRGTQSPQHFPLQKYSIMDTDTHGQPAERQTPADPSTQSYRNTESTQCPPTLSQEVLSARLAPEPRNLIRTHVDRQFEEIWRGGRREAPRR